MISQSSKRHLVQSPLRACWRLVDTRRGRFLARSRSLYCRAKHCGEKVRVQEPLASGPSAQRLVKGKCVMFAEAAAHWKFGTVPHQRCRHQLGRRRMHNACHIIPDSSSRERLARVISHLLSPRHVLDILNRICQVYVFCALCNQTRSLAPLLRGYAEVDRRYRCPYLTDSVSVGG